MPIAIQDSALAVGRSEPNVSPGLRRAAEEFEAQMMKELMKPMTSQGTLMSEDSASGASSSIGEFASEALAQAISRQGGFGVAKSIVKSISNEGAISAAGRGAATSSGFPR